MSFTLRAKRVLVGAAAGAMVLGLMPTGAALADDAVCDNAPLDVFTDAGATHGDNIHCMAAYNVPDDAPAFAGDPIIAGRTATTFEPFGDLTRGQAATLLVKFALVATQGGVAELLDGEAPEFSDVEGTTHETAIGIIADLGLIAGFGDGTFRPNDPMNRAGFATVLHAAHVALGVEFDDEYDNPFTDVDRDEISALAGEGIISGRTATTFDPWSAQQRGAAASLLKASADLLDEIGEWDAPRLPGTDDTVAPSVTEAPDLVRVTVVSDDANRTQVHFEFDDEVQPVGLDANDFYLYGWNGAKIQANDVRRLDQVVGGAENFNVIRAAFTKNAAGYVNATNPVANTVPRFEDVIGAGIVRGAVLGLESALISPDRALALTGSSVPAGFGYAPYATGVSGISSTNNRLDITFSRPITVTPSTTTGVTLYLNTSTGVTQDGVSVTRATTIPSSTLALAPGTNDTLRVGFADLQPTDAANIAVVSIAPRIVQAAGTGVAPAANLLQSVNLGATRDPDLVSVSLDYANDRATFTFSEDLQPLQNFTGRNFGSPTAASFQLHYDNSTATLTGVTPGVWSDVASGSTVTAVTGRSATVQFQPGEVTKDITRAGVAEGAVYATDGTRAPSPAMSIGVAQSFGGLETIGPDLQDVVVTVTARNPIDDEPTAYRIAFVFDTAIAAFGTPATVALYNSDGTFSTVTASAGTTSTVSTAANQLVFTAAGGGDAANGVFPLNAAIDAVAATIEMNAVVPSGLVQADVVSGKIGVGNYAQGVNVTPPS